MVSGTKSSLAGCWGLQVVFVLHVLEAASTQGTCCVPQTVLEARPDALSCWAGTMVSLKACSWSARTRGFTAKHLCPKSSTTLWSGSDTQVSIVGASDSGEGSAWVLWPVAMWPCEKERTIQSALTSFYQRVFQQFETEVLLLSRCTLATYDPVFLLWTTFNRCLVTLQTKNTPCYSWTMPLSSRLTTTSRSNLHNCPFFSASGSWTSRTECRLPL